MSLINFELLLQFDTSNSQSCRRHENDFARCRIIAKLEETKVLLRWPRSTAHTTLPLGEHFKWQGSLFDVLIMVFQEQPQKMTAVSYSAGEYIRPLTSREIAKHMQQTIRRLILSFNVARRSQRGGLYALWPGFCLSQRPALRKLRILWCRKRKTSTDDSYVRVLFTYESRFSLTGDSRRIHIMRE